jgi:hypothetical protein
LGCLGLIITNPAVTESLFRLTTNLLQIRAFHRFAVCSECVTINNEIARAKGPANLKVWKAAKEQHVNDVRLKLSCIGREFLVLFEGVPSSLVLAGHHGAVSIPLPHPEIY